MRWIIPLLITAAAGAQPETPPADPPQTIDGAQQPTGEPPRVIEPVPDIPKGVFFSLEGDVAHAFQAGINDTDGGKVGATLARTRLTARIPVNQRLGFSLDAGVGSILYEFSGPSGVLPGDQSPWERIDVASVGAGVSFAIDYNWRTFGGVNLSSAGEEGTSFDETFTVGATGAIAYVVNERLTVGFGASVQTQLDDNTFFIAFPSVDWTIDEEERWRFVVGGSRLGPSRAVGATLSYKASEEVTLIGGWAGFGLGGDFRLDDSGPAPGGVGRDTSYPVLLGVNWNVTPDLQLSAYAGAALFGEIELLDSNGLRIAKRRVDPQVTLGLGLNWSF